MKKIIIALIVQSVIINLCTAQRVDKPKGSLTKVELYDIFGNIKVTGTNSDHIELELLNKNDIPERFLEHTNKDYQYKQSNTNLDLNLTESGTILKIYPSSKQSQFSDYVLRIPENFEVKIRNKLDCFGGVTYKSIKPNGGNIKLIHEIIIENIISSIEIETFYADINAKQITGPIVAESFQGNITISYVKLNQDLPTSIKTFQGDIDVTLLSGSNCDININTFKGKYKSQFQIHEEDADYRPNHSTSYSKNGKITEKNSPRINSGAIKGIINKGGIGVVLETFNGNINLFKH